MHRRLEQLLQYIDNQRAELLAAVDTVPPLDRERRPTPEVWSVAEVLEHLVIVEQGVARLIARRIDKAKDTLPKETETEPLFGSLDRFALLDREHYMEAPDLVRPTGTLPVEDAVPALFESRLALRAALEMGDGLALGAVSAPHVLLGPLTLYQWVLFIGQHESRHAKQIRDIGASLGTTF
jgi:hypothetical protein